MYAVRAGTTSLELAICIKHSTRDQDSTALEGKVVARRYKSMPSKQYGPEFLTDASRIPRGQETTTNVCPRRSLEICQ